MSPIDVTKQGYWALVGVALRTILRKEVGRFMRIWTQTLIPPVVTNSLYFLIFGNFIGSQIPDVKGLAYMEFIVPGLIMMSMITSSYNNVVSSFFGLKFQKSIEELLVSPVPHWVIVLGWSMGGMIRGWIVSILVFLVAQIFVPFHIHNIGFVFIFVFLCSFMFALMGMINAIFAKKFDDINIIPTFVLTPLTYLGGVFYSLDSLPEVWQTVSLFNPIVYLINGFRYAVSGVSDLNVWYGIAISSVFVAVLFLTNLYLLRKGVGVKS